MLILYRKKGDSVLIGDNITITIVESGSDGARIAIDAPRDVSILRKELLEAAEANKEAIDSDAAASKESLKKINELIKQKK